MKRKRIVIVGAGGMAREVASAVQWINRSEPRFDFLGYVVSDLSRLGERDSREQVLGDFSWLTRNRASVDALALGIGSPAVRLNLAAELTALLNDVEWPALIHPTAVIDLDSAKLGSRLLHWGWSCRNRPCSPRTVCTCKFRCHSRARIAYRSRFRSQSRCKHFWRRSNRRGSISRHRGSDSAIPSDRLPRHCRRRRSRHKECRLQHDRGRCACSSSQDRENRCLRHVGSARASRIQLLKHFYEYSNCSANNCIPRHANRVAVCPLALFRG